MAESVQVDEMLVRAVKVPIFYSPHNAHFYATVGTLYQHAPTIKALRSKLLEAAKRQDLKFDVTFDIVEAVSSETNRWRDREPGSTKVWQWRRGHVIRRRPRDNDYEVHFDAAPKKTQRRDRYGRKGESDVEFHDSFHDDDDHWNSENHVFPPLSDAQRAEFVALYGRLYDLHREIDRFVKEHHIDVSEEVDKAIAEMVDKEPEEKPEPKRKTRKVA